MTQDRRLLIETIESLPTLVVHRRESRVEQDRWDSGSHRGYRPPNQIGHLKTSDGIGVVVRTVYLIRPSTNDSH